MPTKYIVGLAIGSGLGFLLGYFGKCSTGTCPLTSNYYVSTLYGGIVGLLVAGALAAESSPGSTKERSENMAVTSRFVKEITDAEFRKVVESSKGLVFVDVWSPWCGPCRIMGPIVDSLAEKYEGRVAFHKLNVQDNPLTPQALEIDAVPTVLLFKNGQLVRRIIGLRDADELSATLDELLA